MLRCSRASPGEAASSTIRSNSVRESIAAVGDGGVSVTMVRYMASGFRESALPRRVRRSLPDELARGERGRVRGIRVGDGGMRGGEGGGGDGGGGEEDSDLHGIPLF